MSDQEEKIERRLSEIDVAIGELTAERRALQNLLYMDVIEEKGRSVKNARSYKRIYNEEKIKQVISNNTKGLSIRQIYNALSRMGISLKDSTIRSHLSRMRKRNEVYYSSLSQKWLLPLAHESEENP